MVREVMLNEYKIFITINLELILKNRFMNRIILTMLLITNSFLLLAQGDNINPPSRDYGFWNELQQKEETMTVSIFPFVFENGQIGLNVVFTQQCYKTEKTNGSMFTLPEYYFYYDNDYVKVVCRRRDGSSKTFRHSFEYIEEKSNVELTIPKTHSFEINQSTGFNPECGDVISVYVNDYKVAVYKMPSLSYFGNYEVAAERNSALSKQYRQLQMQLIMMGAQMGPKNNNNYNSGSSSSSRSRKCSFCGGTGVSPIKKNVANYTDSKYYCDVCNEYSYSHYHESCPSCNGTGYTQ